MGNPFVHLDLQTSDPEKAQSFYGELLDWKFNPMEGMDYSMIDVGEGTGGGVGRPPVEGAPSQWVAFIQVEDAAATTAKAVELGATVAMEVGDIPNVGKVKAAEP